MKKHLIYCLLLPALTLVGCIEDAPFAEPEIVGGDGLQATLTLRIAGGGTATRAMGTTAENDIDEIDILVFSKTGAATPDDAATFDYRAQTTLVGTGGSDNTKNFRVTLRQSEDADDLQKIVVFANCRPVIEALNFTGKTYSQAMAALVMEKDTPWESGGVNAAGAPYDPLPMWGEGEGTDAGFKAFTDPSKVPSTINLYRAVAAIDVVVATAAQSDFTLSEVRLYNPATRGALSPAAANWDATTREATNASLPSGTGGFAYSATPFAYTTMTTSDKALEGVIYTFEAPAASGNTDTAASFLLVKGSWNGEADSWYRIDFFGKLNSTATENVYLPLLRNYRYTVSIDGVSGRGYGSPDEAANASFTNIQATTHTLNEGNIERVVWDGYNYLAVTTNTYEIGNSNVVQNIGHISATTNYSTGWTATVKIATGDQAGWLTLTNTSGAGDENAQPLGMSVQPNTGTGNRTAVVTVTAGRLKQTVTVTQLLNQKLSLDIGNVEAVFPAKTTPAMFSLPIEWEPAGTPVQIEIIHAGTPAAAAYATEYNDNRLNGYSNGLIFSGDNVISATLVDTDGNPSNGGTALLSICPDKDENLDTFAERRTILKITSNNGATPVAHTEVKTVLLRQLDYEIVLEGERETYQPNTTYSIIVKSNAPWEVAATGPNAGEINILSAFYGEPNTEGVTLTFKTGGTDNAEPKLTFTPVGGAQKEVGVLLKQMLPNCYIVAPGTTNFTFPIAKVWEVWSTDRDLVGEYPAALEGTLSANLLWQDVQGLIISQPTLNGADRDATISLSTASLSGNAVVELKVDGVTRWSWHIWVCDFDPDENTGYNAYNGLIIMERNLGAMNNTPGDAGSFGLLYQWGRKDPFLSSGSATPPITAKPVYEFGGATVDMTAEATSQIMNLIETISYPFRFYTGQLWYTNDDTSLEFHRMDFWDSSIVGKTIFDPCPEGWKTPIENMMMYVNPASYVIGEGLYAGTIGFFPSVPYRNAGDATLITVIPQNSYYHSGLSFFTGGLSGYGNSHNISPTRVALSPIGPAMGIPARCVKIQ